MNAGTQLAPPPRGGTLDWAQRRLFSTWIDGAITLMFGTLVVWILWKGLGWAFIGNVWKAESGAACRDHTGACWAVIEARGRLILFGLYPYEEHWRSTIACLAIIVTTVLSCIPWFWQMKRLSVLWVAGFGLFLGFMFGGFLGMPLVTTEKWGGLSLTVLLFSAVVVIGMPLAIAMALLRRSKLLVVRWVVGGIIDVTRSLPLLTILFAAAVVVPFVVPDWAQGDKLVRVVLAFAVFFAAYQAEIIRAGLQAIPEGQEEAAAALGLRYFGRTFLIMLPQAFRNALPATINQVVITFKETSIVTIIGFFEVMSSANAAVGRGDWSGQFIEVYVFVGFIYFIFVFGLSRYGAYLEQRARRADR